MILPRKRLVRESLIAALCIALGLILAPIVFYETTQLESLWGDGVYTVTAFDRFWDDVRYREISKVWWKILLPYFAFLTVRAIIFGSSRLKKDFKQKSDFSNSLR